jgi:putative transposase
VKLHAENPRLGIKALCNLFGKTRHAYYDAVWREKANLLTDDLIIQLVKAIRKELPRLGTRKLHHMLADQLLEHKVDIGRDALFELLDNHKLLVRNRKRKVITTDSRHWMRKYSNLILDMKIDRPEQVWVSDITYIRFKNEFVYLSLITDAYSHKIVGFNLRKDMAAQGCVAALEMALAARKNKHKSLIHHSDRGAQYCCKEYIDRLKENNIAISMTNNGDPYENAIAERVNGILKQEFSLYGSQLGFEETGRLIEKSINAYNQIRPHSSCNYLTPDQAHQQTGVLARRWKNYPGKYLQTHKFEKNDPV